MLKHLLGMACLAGALAAAGEATVSQVAVAQRYPWKGYVDVDYVVSGEVPASMRVELKVKDLKNGLVYTPTKFFGAAPTAQAGSHRVTWDAAAEGVEVASDQVVATVSIVSTQIATPTARYLVVDLSAGATATSYPMTQFETIPQGGWSNDYKTTKLVLRRIDPGRFIQSQGGRMVTLTHPYYIGVFEVTQKQYELVMGHNPSLYKGEMRPVELVSYDMLRGINSPYPSDPTTVASNTFIAKLRERTNLLSFDLPTSAQWEYATRAGSTNDYPNGLSPMGAQYEAPDENLNKIARNRYNRNDGKGGYAQHTTVGSYLPNDWGLYDVLGNVSEWCLDWWEPTQGTEPVTDPVGSVGPNTAYGTQRYQRGGNWFCSPLAFLETGAGSCSVWDNGYNGDRGFRMAATMPIDPEPAAAVVAADSPICVLDTRAGTVVAPKERVIGEKATWQAKASSGSVFARWEGACVAGLPLNVRRNPVLTLTVAEGMDLPKAVFTTPAADVLTKLGLSTTTFKVGEAVTCWLVDDSTSFVTATLTGLPAGLVFDAKTLAVTGVPKKAGLYTVAATAKNASGHQLRATFGVTVLGDPAAPVVSVPSVSLGLVVGTGEGTVSGSGVYAPGRTVSISARAAKGFVFGGWYRDATLTQPAAFASGDYRKASQKVVASAEVPYLYARFVAADGTSDPVTDLKLVGSGVDGTNIVWYAGVALESAGTDFLSASLATLSVKGLPSGVKFTASTGRLAGVPTKAGTYKVTVTAKNQSKSTAQTVYAVTVVALPAWAQGTFEGGGVDALATFKVGATGKASGKILRAGKTYTLSSPSYAAYEEKSGIYSFTATAKCGRDVLPCAGLVTAKTRADGTTVGVCELTLGLGGEGEVGVILVQTAWSKSPWKELAKSLRRTVALTGEADGLGANDTVTMKISAAGKVTAAGVFDTGRVNARGVPQPYKVSSSGALVPGKEAGTGIVYLYFPPNPAKNFAGFVRQIPITALP